MSEADENLRKAEETGFGPTHPEHTGVGTASGSDPTMPSPASPTFPAANWIEPTQSAAPIPDGGSPLLGRFRLLRRLGHGGMGDVWEAVDLQLKTRIALKTIRPNLANRGEFVEMMRREVLLAREVNHPNVCRLFEFFVGVDASHGAVALFTMELIEGVTLAQHLKDHGALSRRDALPLLREMAEGLNAAHSKGVVHRDFKPGNVMLAKGGESRRAVVMDFGIARREATEWVLGAESPAGTPAYIAPEQARGDAPTVRSDVFSFAIVAEEVVTGSRDGTGAVPRSWRRVLSKGRAEDPKARFESPLAMVQRLERLRLRPFAAALPIVLALLAALVLWRHSIGVQARVGALVEKSRALYLAYDFPLAVRAADQALSLDPHSAMAHFSRARALSSYGRDREAAESREAAFRYSDRAALPDKLLIQASYWMHVGKREQAGELARRLYQLFPENQDHLRAYAYFEKPPERLALYERIRMSGSSLALHPYFHIGEAVRASEAGEETKRLAALDRLDALGPGPEFRFLVATALTVRESYYFYQEDWEEALRLLAGAEQIYRQAGPEYDFQLARALGRRALVYRFSGELEKSISVNEQAISMLEPLGSASELCLLLAHLSDALAAKGLLREAQTTLERIENLVSQAELRHDTSANCRDYWANSVFLAREMGHLDRARKSLDASAKLFPGAGFYGPAELQLQRALLLYEEDKLDEALEAAEKMNVGATALTQSTRQLLRGTFGLDLGRSAIVEDALSTLRAGASRSPALRQAALELDARVVASRGSRAEIQRTLVGLRTLTREATSRVERNAARLLALRLAFRLGPTQANRDELQELLEWAQDAGAKRMEFEARLLAIEDPLLSRKARQIRAAALADDAAGLGYIRLARLAAERARDLRTLTLLERR